MWRPIFRQVPVCSTEDRTSKLIQTKTETRPTLLAQLMSAVMGRYGTAVPALRIEAAAVHSHSAVAANVICVADSSVGQRT